MRLSGQRPFATPRRPRSLSRWIEIQGECNVAGRTWPRGCRERRLVGGDGIGLLGRHHIRPPGSRSHEYRFRQIPPTSHPSASLNPARDFALPFPLFVRPPITVVIRGRTPSRHHLEKVPVRRHPDGHPSPVRADHRRRPEHHPAVFSDHRRRLADVRLDPEPHVPRVRRLPIHLVETLPARTPPVPPPRTDASPGQERGLRSEGCRARLRTSAAPPRDPGRTG